MASELIFNPIVGIEIFLVFFLSVSGPEISGQDKPNVSPESNIYYKQQEYRGLCSYPAVPRIVCTCTYWVLFGICRFVVVELKINGQWSFKCGSKEPSRDAASPPG